MSKEYSRVSFVVGNDMLGTVIQVLTDKRVTGIRVDKADGSDISTLPKRVVRSSRSKPSETRLGALVVKILSAADVPVLVKYVQDGIENEGFKRDSASPVLGDLAREGVVVVDKSVNKQWRYSLA